MASALKVWVKCDGQRSRTANPGRGLPRCGAGAPGAGHPPGDDSQGFGELDSGEVGAKAVVRPTTEGQHRCRALPGDVETIGVVVYRRIAVRSRFKIHQNGYDAAVTALREAMGNGDFDAAWAEGAALSTEEAIAYAQRGRGERKRPATGWESLTPAEREVVRLVSDGLPNKDIATRLFVSPRTVHAHLAHVYTKLGINSRVQLVQAAARRT